MKIPAARERGKIASLSDLFTASLTDTLQSIVFATNAPPETRVRAWRALGALEQEPDRKAPPVWAWADEASSSPMSDAP